MQYHSLDSTSYGVCCVMVREGVLHCTGIYSCLHAIPTLSVCSRPMVTQPTQGWCLSDRQHPDMDVHAQVQLLVEGPSYLTRRLLQGYVLYTAPFHHVGQRSYIPNCSLSFPTADKEADEYYMRRRHLPDLAARGTLPINVIKMSQQTNHRDRPRRPIRAMSQDRVLSPERIMPEEFSMSYERILSDEQLLSAERLHSQDPLLSPERSGYPEQSMSRALSHTDVFVSTPVLDRYRMTKMHSHPSASNNLYNTLGMNPTSAKRQAFASRRHNTVEQLHYIPGHHHYRTASKTEVTV